MIRSLLLTLAAAWALAGCDRQPVQQYAPAQQPVIIQQDSGMGVGTAAALGAGAGFLAGRLTAHPAAPTTVYVPTQVNAPAPTNQSIQAVPTQPKAAPAPVAIGATKAGGNAVKFAPSPSKGISLSKGKR